MEPRNRNPRTVYSRQYFGIVFIFIVYYNNKVRNIFAQKGQQMRYSAQIYMRGKHGQWLTPIYPRISDIGRYLRRAFDRKLFEHHDESEIREIVVIKARRGKRPIIHGYYDFRGDRLILDRSKPAHLNNLIYGLEG